MTELYLQPPKFETIFRLEVRDKEGNLKERTPDFNNIVLDQGLERLGSGGVLNYCRVGAGASKPVGTQTNLDEQVAATSSVTESNHGVNVARGYNFITRKYRFGTGVAAGNLTEVAVGWGPTGDSIYNRAMIRDTSNNPTTVTVLSDEVLDIFVELRAYTPLTTTKKTATISGTEYEIFFKPLITNKSSAFSTDYRCTSATGYSGPIQDANTYPSGSGAGFGITNASYIPGTLEKVFSVYWGLNTGNSAPLQTVVMETPYSTYQAQFNPPIPKTAETVLKLSFKIGWGRYE